MLQPGGGEYGGASKGVNMRGVYSGGRGEYGGASMLQQGVIRGGG